MEKRKRKERKWENQAKNRKNEPKIATEGKIEKNQKLVKIGTYRLKIVASNTINRNNLAWHRKIMLKIEKIILKIAHIMAWPPNQSNLCMYERV